MGQMGQNSPFLPSRPLFEFPVLQLRIQSWVYYSVAVPLSLLNKREVLKTPYIQIWCRCGHIGAPH